MVHPDEITLFQPQQNAYPRGSIERYLLNEAGSQNMYKFRVELPILHQKPVENAKSQVDIEVSLLITFFPKSVCTVYNSIEYSSHVQATCKHKQNTHSFL